jgi:hypothetical protein
MFTAPATAQHLDACQVHEGHARLVAAAVVHAVLEQAHRLLETLVEARTDAADVDVVGDACLGHLQVGHIGLQVVKPHNARVLQLVAQHCLDGDRHVAQGFLALLGRDDDFVEDDILLLRHSGLLHQCQCRSGAANDGHANETANLEVHADSPGRLRIGGHCALL